MNLLAKALGIDKLINRQVNTVLQQIGGTPNYGKFNDAYESNDTVFTVIKKIGMKAASVPMYAYKPKSDQSAKRYKSVPFNNLLKRQVEKVKSLDEMDQNSALAKLIQRPNPYIGADAFWDGVFSFRAYRGEVFMWKNRGGKENGEVLELYVLPPDQVAVVPVKNDPFAIYGYILEIGGKQIALPKEDVIHWKSFNPCPISTNGEQLRGFDPMQPLTRRLQQDQDAMDAAVAMFSNQGGRGFVYNESLDTLTPEQMTQIKSVIDGKLNNKLLKGSVATLQGKWGYVDVGKSSVDMELLKSQGLTLERIALGLGIDPDVLIPGQSFSNKEWAQKKFVTDLIMPLCNSLRDELNRSLRIDFKDNSFIDFDFSLLPELQEDYSKMITVYTSMFDRGALNGNEFRELLGFETTNDPMHQQFLITGNYTPIGDAMIPNEQPVDPNMKYLDY